jgi:hypothetical protein
MDNLISIFNNNYYDKYKFIIYIDTSINDKYNLLMTSFIDFCIMYNNRIELVDIEMSPFMNDDMRGHIGLLGTLFRYIPLFNPDIKYCFIADSDNYNNIFLDKILKKFFNFSKNNLLIFKPVLYSRNNDVNNCVPNILAGMMAFKKNKNSIFNLNIWQNMFVFIDNLYTKIKKSNSNISCYPNIDKNTGKNPFEFGFEEQALSNIFIFSVLNAKYNISSCTLVWYNNEKVNKYYIYNIMIKKYKLINIEFLLFLYKKLNIIFNDNKFLNSKLFYILNNYDNNLHINLIIENIIYSLILDNNNNNFKNIKLNKINLFNSQNDFIEYKRLSSIILLFVIYPGYEINIDNNLLMNITHNIYDNKKINKNDLLKFEKTHNIKYEIIYLLNKLYTKDLHIYDNVFDSIKDIIPNNLIKDFSIYNDKFKSYKGLTTKGYITNNKFYKKYYNQYSFYIEFYAVNVLNVDKKFDNFDILKIYSIDKINKIIEL